MLKKKAFLLVLFFFLTLGQPSSAIATKNSRTDSKSASTELESRVDPWVLTQIENGPAEYLLLLNPQADLSRAVDLRNKTEKRSKH